MKTKVFGSKNQGLSLVEALVGMTIFLIALAFMIPLLANNQINVIKNEIDTGAISVSQKILDELRQTDVSTLPLSGTLTTLPSGTNISSIPEIGKNYSAKIIYCESNINCNTTAREIEVQVSYNAQTIYKVKTIYTKFE